jgi:hypothetical protein
VVCAIGDGHGEKGIWSACYYGSEAGNYVDCLTIFGPAGNQASRMSTACDAGSNYADKRLRHRIKAMLHRPAVAILGCEQSIRLLIILEFHRCAIPFETRA